MSVHRSNPRPWSGLWSGVVCLLFACVSVHEVYRLNLWKELRILSWDAEGYHDYLPAVIIHHDLLDLDRVRAIDSLVLHPTSIGQRAFGASRIPWTGHDLIKYGYGTALFELPLFLVAHAYCHLPGATDPPNGYSAPYQLATGISTALFVSLGLFMLRRFLLRQEEDRAVALALIVIGFGTNLFCCATQDVGMSHGYLFFLFALVLDRTDRWHRTPKAGTAAIIGSAIGLTLVTRPVDALVLLVPLCWNVWPKKLFAEKKALLRAHPTHVLWAIAAAAVPIIPQLLYWKAATDHWVFYSYLNEAFHFNDPHILDGLFSYRKGWFVYSPLVLLGIIGLVLMLADRRRRTLAIPVLACLLPAIYIIFSWYDWAYGGSFGCRPLIAYLALLGLPTAVLAGRVLRSHRIFSFLFAALILAGVQLNFFQQAQYLTTIIRWDGMTKERYWRVFGVDSWEGLEPFDP